MVDVVPTKKISLKVYLLLIFLGASVAGCLSSSHNPNSTSSSPKSSTISPISTMIPQFIWSGAFNNFTCYVIVLNNQTVPVYIEATTTSLVMGHLKNFAPIESRAENWLEIMLPSGEMGWVETHLVEVRFSCNGIRDSRLPIYRGDNPSTRVCAISPIGNFATLYHTPNGGYESIVGYLEGSAELDAEYRGWYKTRYGWVTEEEVTIVGICS